MKYELIDQTGKGFRDKDKQWLIVANDGKRQTGFCIIPQWIDQSPEKSKADAELILRALQSSDRVDLLCELARTDECLKLIEPDIAPHLQEIVGKRRTAVAARMKGQTNA